jgi:hypothetical protein
MPPPVTLPAIQDQASLLGFLLEHLDWPIPLESQLDEITFDWTDTDLRLSNSTANRLEDGTIHQFQPLVSGQPFGIFLVEFNDPKVYRTALRQIVRALVPPVERTANNKAGSTTISSLSASRRTIRELPSLIFAEILRPRPN